MFFSDRNFIVKNNTIFLLLVSLILFSGLDAAFELLRYVKYLIIPLVIFLFVVTKIEIKEVHKAFYVFLLTSFLSLFFSNLDGIKDFIFILCYALPFLFIRDIYYTVERVFLMTVVIFIIGVLVSGIGSFNFSLIDSTSSFESHSFAFVFGLFSVYFLISKKWRWFLISLIFSILVLKRISLVAVLLCTLVTLIPRGFLYKILNWKVMLLFNSVVIYICYYITTDSFNDITIDYLGVSSSYLTMGRSVLYGEIFNYTNWDLLSFIFGKGFGSTYSLLSVVAWEDKVHLHNDILKIMYENGVLTLIIFLYFLYKVPLKNRVFVLYINIIFFTDNTFTYTFVMFFFMFLTLKLYNENTN